MTVRPDDTALSLVELDLRIDGVQIVECVTLDVRRGEFVGVIGPNGAGKTSLLNLISGTLRATSGSIALLGADVTRWPPHRRARAGLARTFQTSYLLLGLSALENVRLVAQARERGLRHAFDRVGASDRTIGLARESLELVGLAGRADMAAAALSHGDRRKLELAMVIAARAELILLDEPMAGVNSEDVDELVELIRRVHHETHSTVVMVEHHMSVVLSLAQRVAVMHHGGLLAYDVPDLVLANETVQAAYLGEAL